MQTQLPPVLGDDGKKIDEDSRKDSEGIDQEKEDNVNNTNNVNAASTNEVNAVGGKTSIELPLDPNMPELEDYSMLEKPKKVIHALKGPSWIEAMQEEIDIMAVQEIDSGCKFHNRSCICGYFKLLWISALDSESTN
ncbi:hypothetical protein Tco_1513636 [Tanacetum coccineum]